MGFNCMSKVPKSERLALASVFGFRFGCVFHDTFPLVVNEKFEVNTMDIDGILSRVWDRKGDFFARQAVRDLRAEILEPVKERGCLDGRPMMSRFSSIWGRSPIRSFGLAR
jgi:hypothetical protein